MSLLAFPKEDEYPGNLPYTRRTLHEELSLLERHLRDGSAELCGCAFDNHLPLIAGLATEGVKFGENEDEREFYASLRDWAHQRTEDLLSAKGYPAEDLIKETRERRLYIAYEGWLNPMPSETVEVGTGNPVPAGCTFKVERVHPKTYFDRKSFRTLCPECPEMLCSQCPPSLECSTRVIIGCKKGHYTKGACQIATEVHKVEHAAS